MELSRRADNPRMDRRQAERWADAVLDGARSAPEGSASLDDEPFAEAIARNRARQRTFAKYEAIAVVIGVLLLAGFAYSLLSTF